ncbi:hypothetical protein K438DRAFT_1961958 [Mycena galopus ATCC 62051]|nr:hypothetical protein K438DRAFT_1961958 [Mycena galopus ATCC 62051]
MPEQCGYCKMFFLNETAVFQHQAQAPACKRARDDYIQKTLLKHKRRRSPSPGNSTASASVADDAPLVHVKDLMNVDTSDPAADRIREDPELPDNDAQDPEPHTNSAKAKGHTDEFPEEYKAGGTYGPAKTMFEHIRCF